MLLHLFFVRCDYALSFDNIFLLPNGFLTFEVGFLAYIV